MYTNFVSKLIRLQRLYVEQLEMDPRSESLNGEESLLGILGYGFSNFGEVLVPTMVRPIVVLQ